MTGQGQKNEQKKTYLTLYSQLFSEGFDFCFLVNLMLGWIFLMFDENKVFMRLRVQREHLAQGIVGNHSVISLLSDTIIV